MGYNEQIVINADGTVLGTVRELQQKKRDEARRAGPLPAPPERPAGLDKRLSWDQWERFAASWESDGYEGSDCWQVFDQIEDSIREELEAIEEDFDWFELLSESRRHVIVSCEAETGICSAGFSYYYESSYGNGASFVADAYRAMGFQSVASLFDEMNGEFETCALRDPNTRVIALAALPESADDRFGDGDMRFFEMQSDTGAGNNSAAACLPYIYKNREAFFRRDGE